METVKHQVTTSDLHGAYLSLPSDALSVMSLDTFASIINRELGDPELIRPVLTRAFAVKMLELITSVSSYAESFVIDRTSRDCIIEGLQLLAATIRKPLLGEESEGATDA